MPSFPQNRQLDLQAGFSLDRSAWSMPQGAFATLTSGVLRSCLAFPQGQGPAPNTTRCQVKDDSLRDCQRPERRNPHNPAFLPVYAIAPLMTLWLIGERRKLAAQRRWGRWCDDGGAMMVVR